MRIAVAVGCVALALVLSLHSCKKARTGRSTFDDYNAAVDKGIKKHVKDKERRNKLRALHAKGILQQMDTALIFTAAGVQMRSRADLSREEAEGILADAAEKRLAAIREVSATRREMRTLMTEEEWDKVFTAPAREAKGKE